MVGDSRCSGMQGLTNFFSVMVDILFARAASAQGHPAFMRGQFGHSIQEGKHCKYAVAHLCS